MGNIINKYNQIIVVIFYCTTFFLRNSFPVIGQESKKLLQILNKHLKEIESTELVINETARKKSTSMNQLLILDRKIVVRGNFVKELGNEITYLDNSINENEKLIKSLEDDLLNIKNEYAQIIHNSYKSRNNENFLIYLFSSDNFNQAYKRVKYLKQYTTYKTKQYKMVIAYENVIRKKNDELYKKRREKKLLLVTQKEEGIKLITEKKSKQLLINSLQKEELALRNELKNKRNAASRIENEVRRIIKTEREKLKSSSLYDALTPLERIISNRFEDNRGSLPWPTDRGIITGKFGIQNHPVLNNVKVRNDGIYISTIPGEDARSVFDGVVSRIFSFPGSNYAVIIKHGNYYTLYNNLSQVYVKEGEQVKTKQKIGKIFTDYEKSETILDFQVWKEMEKTNPQVWLSN